MNRDTKTLEGRVVWSDVVETYVPIMNGNKFRGAFEIYYDISSRKENLDKLVIHSNTTLLAIAAILLITTIVVLFKSSRIDIQRKEVEKEREKLIGELQDALAQVKTLRGLLPICANCKKIRDEKGYWNQIESYISQHSEADFSHGICPDCLKKLYPEIP